jgi:hypothetical protein
MPVAAALRALLGHSIDYAGMFPPCSLDLEPALTNQAAYVRGSDAWMLNGFVLPIGQFDAARQHLSQFDPQNPLRVSALGPKSENAAGFDDALADTVAAIRSFSGHNVDLIVMTQLEMQLPPDVNSEVLDNARKLVGNRTTFWETPPDRAERTINLLAAHNSSGGYHPFGYKLRTGGVNPEAFPGSRELARALVAPAKHQVPIKFTAGLHHPIRQYRDEVNTKMHGFLNVLGAAVLAAEHQWDEKQTSDMLEDEDAGSFFFDDQIFAWRDWKIAIDRLEARRKFVTSFGSCSFDEPREDLRTLGFL